MSDADHPHVDNAAEAKLPPVTKAEADAALVTLRRYWRRLSILGPQHPDWTDDERPFPEVAADEQAADARDDAARQHARSILRAANVKTLGGCPLCLS